MTDRHSGYIDVLDKDMREDDAQATIAALQRIKGVLTVEPVVSEVNMLIAQARAETEFKQKLVDTFFTKKPNKDFP